jgi:hypothetical protein
VETHGPLGVIWESVGLVCFYIAQIWINSQHGMMITPLFTLLGNSIWNMIRHKKRVPPAV